MAFLLHSRTQQTERASASGPCSPNSAMRLTGFSGHVAASSRSSRRYTAKLYFVLMYSAPFRAPCCTHPVPIQSFKNCRSCARERPRITDLQTARRRSVSSDMSPAPIFASRRFAVRSGVEVTSVGIHQHQELPMRPIVGETLDLCLGCANSISSAEVAHA
jgi:hypothetical protein